MNDFELIVDLLKDALGTIKNHYENKGQISFDCPVCSYEIKGLDKLDSKGNLVCEGERNHIHQRTMFGLLGQQVKETLTKLGLNYNDFAGYQDKEEEHGPSGWTPSYTEEDKTVSLAYDDFIAPLIKSVQELSAEVTELKAQLKTT